MSTPLIRAAAHTLARCAWNTDNPATAALCREQAACLLTLSDAYDKATTHSEQLWSLTRRGVQLISSILATESETVSDDNDRWAILDVCANLVEATGLPVENLAA